MDTNLLNGAKYMRALLNEATFEVSTQGMVQIVHNLRLVDMTLEQADKAARAQEVVDGAANSEDDPTDDE